ncbi:hypothetical protein BA190_26780 [Labrys sp. WJW]|uniref:helix-turn-helix domain-containing protein n=1 Tax=Labrys sp. WJW TaxID=1737983 RepID=UPI00083469E7|nr:helix-turn-helix domain-containing protein [Labrys sp. WJW]OCC01820.1 hypothetical protein BA190_26780 [Labrys sp. WJW]
MSSAAAVTVEQCLRDRVAELEELVRQQQEAFAPTLQWPPAFKLTATKARLLAALFKANGRIVPHSSLRYLLPTDNGGDWDENIVKVHISGLRQRLAPFDLFIHTHWGVGYSLTGLSRSRLASMLGEQQV